MAKTFKTTPAPAAAEPAKPISERDFFDLTDEPVAPLADKKAKAVDNTSSTSNNKKLVNTGNNNNIGNTNTEEIGPPTLEERDLRQTFVVSSGQLEQLRDYVHARRANGDYEYSQKQALQEALSLLFASVPQAPPRPSQTRELEQRRRERIRRGRAS
jgi:hypothetical protein